MPQQGWSPNLQPPGRPEGCRRWSIPPPNRNLWAEVPRAAFTSPPDETYTHSRGAGTVRGLGGH